MWKGIVNLFVVWSLIALFSVGCDCEYIPKNGGGRQEVERICQGNWYLDESSKEYCRDVLGYERDVMPEEYSFRLLTNGVAFVHCPNNYTSAKDPFFQDVYPRCVKIYKKILRAGGRGKWWVVDRSELSYNSSPVEDWSWMVCCDVEVDGWTYGYKFYLRKDSNGLYLGIPVCSQSGNVQDFMRFRKTER